MLLLSKPLQAQTLVNKEWERAIGAPDTAVNWSATHIDASGNLTIAGNTITAPGETAFLITQYDRTGTQIWQQTYQHNGNVKNYATAITGDANGNLFVTGATSGSNLGFDFLTLQLDTSGNVSWASTFDGASHLYDIPLAITLDISGNVIVTGSSFDVSTQSDYATVKYDANGTELWTATYDYTGLHDAAIDVKTDANDNVIVTGASASTNNNYDYFTLEYDKYGSQTNMNRQNVAGQGLDNPLAMERDASGNIYITGKVQNGSDIDIRTIKLDAGFIFQWAKTYNNVGLEDAGQSISIDGTGNVYVTGFTTNTAGDKDILTLKYDASGNTIWEKTYSAEGNFDIEGLKVCVDNQGIVYVAGNQETATGTDFITLRYNADGEIEWIKSYGSTGNDVVMGLKTEDNGDVYVTGRTEINGVYKYGIVKYASYQVLNNVVYDTTQTPIYIDNQVIVNFKPEIVNTNFVNNKELIFTTLDKVIPDSVISAMSQKMNGYNFQKKVKISKIFPHFGTSDTLSIARTGDTISVPKFWSSFLLHFSTNIDAIAVTDSFGLLNDFIIYSHPNHVYELAGAPNDALYLAGKFAGLAPTASISGADINVEPAWDISTGWNNIKAGVYDTGIFWQHEDLGGPNWGNPKVVGGWDWGQNVPINHNLNDPSYKPDERGHGTICAGLLAGLRNNSIGVSGIAGGDGNGNTGIQLFSMKIDLKGISANPQDPTLTTDAVIAVAITEGSHYYPASNPPGYGLDIMNHSWSGDNLAYAVYDAVKFAHDNEVVFAAASGNDFSNNPNLALAHYPASYPDNWVLKVGANDANGTRAFFSRHHNYLDILAPGTDDLYEGVDNALTGYTDDYSPNSIANGTSFASPLAAGTAGIMLSHVKNAAVFIGTNGANRLLPEDVENLMQIYASDISPTGYDEETGFGKLDAGETMAHIEANNYKVWHGLTSATIGNTFIATPVAQDVPLKIQDRYNIPGVSFYPDHIVDVYALEVTVPLPPYLPANEAIIHAWGTANSSTMPFPSAPYFWANGRGCEVVSWNSNNNSITLRGYTYHIKTGYNYIGQSIVIDVYYPYNPANVNDFATFFYTLHTHVTPITTIENASVSQGTLTATPSIIDIAQTKISYQIQEAIPTEINLYNINGQKIRNLYLGSNKQGNITSDFSDLASGIYIIHLKNNSQSLYTKIVKI